MKHILVFLFLFNCCFSQNIELSLANKNYDSQNFKEAIYWYTKYLDKNDTSAYSYCLRAVCYSLIGDSVKAMEDFNKALSLDKKNPKIFYQLGQFHFFNKKFKTAITNYNEALKIKERPEYYHGKALSYFMLRDVNSAIDNETKSILIDSTYSEAIANRGYYYYLLEKNTLSLKDLNSAIKLNPKDFVSYANRAMTYLKIGKKEEAVSDLSSALSIKPDADDLLIKRGELYLELNKKDEACTDYMNAVKLNSKIKTNKKFCVN